MTWASPDDARDSVGYNPRLNMRDSWIWARVLSAVALLGWTVGYLRRTRAGWSALEVLGGGLIVLGISGWSTEAALIVLGVMLIGLSAVRSKE